MIFSNNPRTRWWVGAEIKNAALKRSGGFTLLELVVVIVIVGSIAGVALVNLVKTKDGVILAEAKSNLGQLANASWFYHMKFFNFPAEENDDSIPLAVGIYVTRSRHWDWQYQNAFPDGLVIAQALGGGSFGGFTRMAIRVRSNGTRQYEVNYADGGFFSGDQWP